MGYVSLDVVCHSSREDTQMFYADLRNRNACYNILRDNKIFSTIMGAASNQRTASKLSVKPKNSETFPPRRSTIATPPGLHRPTNHRHATQQKGKHHSRHAPNQRLVTIWD
ncbi:hypothetical protein TNCV_4688151 [Trichonephila clavipes]|nr:hypothetical protein TNCV_4688151 [Trichonephila clavipes]